MPAPGFASVDAYLAAQPPAVAAAVQQVRETLREALPGAVEAISYQVPTFKLHGRNLVHYAGYPHHVGVYPVTEALAEAMGDELAPFRSGKATLRFPLDQPLPLALIRRIAQQRWKEGSAAQAGRRRA